MTLTAFLAILALASAAPAQEGDQPALVGTSWQLSAIGDLPASPGPNGQAPHITFNADAVSAFYGCNFGEGSYVADRHGALSIQHLSVTRRRCQNKIMLAEMAFAHALRDTTHFAVAGGRLELYDAQDRLVATLNRRAAN